MQELKLTELERVTGGVCLYEGKEYSTGAKKEQEGEVLTCQPDGSWG
ncbi:DUF1496 domain-containing protein [Shewanella sp.]